MNFGSAKSAKAHTLKTLPKKTDLRDEIAAMLTFLRIARRRTAPLKQDIGQLGFRIAQDVKASEHSAGLVLIHLTRGTVFSANRAGAIIWNGAAQRWPLDRIAQSISAEFHIPAEAARLDAAEFVAQLAAEGLLIAEAN